MRAIENAIENIDDMLDAIVNTMLWLAYFVMISPFLVIGGTVYQKANGIPSLGKLRRQIKLDIGPPPETTIRREQIASKVKALVETGGWDELSKTLRDQEKDLLSTGLNQFYETAGNAARLALAHTTTQADLCPNVTIADISPAALALLEAAQCARPKDHILAALCARAHTDAAWICRISGETEIATDQARTSIIDHSAKAANILKQFDPLEHMSPLLAEAHYHLCLGADEGEGEIRAAHQDWTDLDPANLTPYSIHGVHLLPRWYGSYDELESEARKAAARTYDILGAGAYSAFYLAVLDQDHGSFAHLDTGFFLDGLADLIEASGFDQLRVNEIAAFLYQTSRPARPVLARADRLVKAQKRALRAGMVRLIRNHLHLVYPEVWQGGRNGALRAIGEAFRDEIIAGEMIQTAATPSRTRIVSRNLEHHG